MLRVKSPQDFGAALFFMLFGLAAVYFARHLALGTAMRIGPGYFPTLLGWLIFGIGAVLMVRAVTVQGPSIERPSLRPLLFVIATILAFAVLIETAGLVVAAFVVVIAAAYARRGADLKETLLLAAGLTVFVVAAFVYGLSQPLPLWWGQ
jgi:hypothetical protein